jgi:hypothetical protein
MPTYREFVADCFSTPKIFQRQALAKAGIKPEQKPSQVTLEQWVQLFSLV